MSGFAERDIISMLVRFDSLAQEVFEERIRQINKWGKDGVHSQERLYTILGEEFGEVGRAILDNDQANLREELIQVAAVAMKFIQQLDMGED